MAHSFVQAHDDEATAFERVRPGFCPKALTLLIDTYDTEVVVQSIVARLAPRLAAEGITISAVRLDSGDLELHGTGRCGVILDAAGTARGIHIFASGGLDEYQPVGNCAAEGAPIDGFGVGTSLTTSSDAPALDCAYKLQEYAGPSAAQAERGQGDGPGPQAGLSALQCRWDHCRRRGGPNRRGGGR